MKKFLIGAGGAACVVFGVVGNGCTINEVPGDAGGSSSKSTTSAYVGTTTDATSASTYMTTTTSGGSCSPQTDACQTCQSQNCATAYSACVNDGTCCGIYTQAQTCVTTAGAPSGYSWQYCVAAIGSMTGDAADALSQCTETSCQSACNGATPVTWTGFAMKFTEDFCAGCHFPGQEFEVADPANPGNTISKTVPNDIPQFTDDAQWPYWGSNGMPGTTGPEGGPGWNKGPGMGDNYAEVTGAVSAAMFPQNLPEPKGLPEKIWCGVSQLLPDQCATDFPGHYPKAERFPPSGLDMVGTVNCTWAADGLTCPQPTDVQRAQMVSWIFAGTPM